MSFAPTHCISRVDLMAREMPDGRLQVESGRPGVTFYWDEWPETVMVNGMELTLEDVEHNEVPEGHHPTGDPTIVWGIYL